MSFGARVVIRPDAIAANLDILKRAAPGARVIAAVKANAYGHGLVGASRALTGIDSLAVARLVEAETLRAAGEKKPILLMAGVTDAEEAARAAELACEVVLHAAWQVELLTQVAQRFPRLWLKVDTGMHRLGVYAAAAGELMAQLAPLTDSPPGLMTHLSSADDLEAAATDAQLARFAALVKDFDADISIANSAVLLGWPHVLEVLADGRAPESVWIRPGISLYGISPIAGRTAGDFGLRPAMNFDTALLDVKPVAAGEAVGYGATWTSNMDTRIGIAAAGYGDGYSRFLPSGTPVLVNGRRVSLAGVVSMDLLGVDLGPDAPDRPGDPVRLWGEGLPVEEVASWAGTTAYPLVTGVRDRSGAVR